MKKMIQIALLMALFPQLTRAQEVAAPAEPARAWKFAAGGAFSLGAKLKFHEVVRTGVGGDSGADVDVKNALTLSADLRNVVADGWGVIVGVTVDTEREITGGEFTGAAWGTPYPGTGDKIRVSTLYGSAVYRWTNLYIPFGLNVSHVSYEKASGASGSYDEMGGFGAQFGLGCYINENVAVEVLSRSVAVRLDHEDGPVTTEYRRGFLSSLSLGAKYIFD